MIETEMANRLTKFQGMSAAEESALLSLSASQKASVAENDRKLKGEFLGAAPAISHGTVKNTDAYQSYMTMVSAAK